MERWCRAARLLALTRLSEKLEGLAKVNKDHAVELKVLVSTNSVTNTIYSYTQNIHLLLCRFPSHQSFSRLHG